MSWIEAAERHIAMRPYTSREAITRRFPVAARRPRSPLARNARHLGRSGTSRVTRVLPNDERRSRSQPRFNPMDRIEAAPDGGILAGVVGEDRVFVWRNGNRLKAYRADCPHLGGPLNKGIVVGATIRCPWHHACFDLATGEATAAPAFDALLEYPVMLDDDRFCVKPAIAQTPRRPGRREDSLGTMAIIGGGAAGFAAADAIRKLGWRGGVNDILGGERTTL